MYKKQELVIKTTRKPLSLFRLFILATIILCLGICVILIKTNEETWEERSRAFTGHQTFGSYKQKEPDVVYLDDSGYHLAIKQIELSEIDIKNKLVVSVKEIKQIKLEEENLPEMSRYSAIEHDPTIDENAVPESYKFYILKHLQRRRTCNNNEPIQNIVFLRSHRTGSHTISNIFYRYGDYNNLRFALPNAPTFQSYWPLRFHHSYVAKQLIDKMPPNFVINVARNHKANLRSFIENDTINIAIVRDPVTHFQSIYEYVDMSYFMDLIRQKNDSNYFSNFLKNPEKNILAIMNATQKFFPTFHLLKNAQLFDLGYEHNDYRTKSDLKFIVNELEGQLDFVLVNEYMDESLVLLQRKLCWEVDDMVYIKQRVRRNREDISEEDKNFILSWNTEDNYLYQHFNNTLWKLINQEDDSFWEDVKKLKNLAISMKNKCVRPEYVKEDDKENLKKMWKDNFEMQNILEENISSRYNILCKKLLTIEKNYIKHLKRKQRLAIQESHTLMMSSKYITNIKDGNYFYQKHINSSTNDTNVATSTTEASASIVEDAGENLDVENVDPVEITFGKQ